jgi:hypothetical protein
MMLRALASFPVEVDGELILIEKGKTRVHSSHRCSPTAGTCSSPSRADPAASIAPRAVPSTHPAG